MPMRPLRTPSDYLNLVARCGCSAALCRAATTGNYTKPLPFSLPSGRRGWRFYVWSENSRWSVAIECDEANRCYRVRSKRVA